MVDVPSLLQDWLAENPRVAALLYGGLGLSAAIVLLILWLIFGSGPQRRRGMRRARRLLQSGTWQPALDALRELRRLGRPSAAWQRRFDEFEAEALQAGAQAALADHDFEAALTRSLQAARLLDRPEHEVRLALQTTMLREVRRLFAEPGQTSAATDLIARTLLVQSPCREASFWQALCDLRSGRFDHATANLQVARTGQARALGPDDLLAEQAAPAAPASPFIDPPLYLGALLVRQGQPKEALRYLTEANRIDPGCPFVTLQLGAAMIAAGGDTQLAVRALQRALGPRGLGQWEQTPQRAWLEGLPDQRSHIRKLAAEFPYTCPLWGSDLIAFLRQGHLALAQGQYRLGNLAEAAPLFELALKEGAPSLVVLRGLGLSLARLGRYDEAFKHLLTAHDLEEVKDRFTAGYLALCGACGTPSSAEDQASNIAWAVRSVQQWNAPADAEWAGLISTIFAEARSHDVPLSADDQLYLCEHLLTVNAVDVPAAQAFHHLMATQPRLVRPEYAWLFCQADQAHQVGGTHALELYALAFGTHAAAAASFYETRGWDRSAVEYSYLARAAELAPGRFPEPLGPDYPARGVELLLERSAQLERAGQAEAALEAVTILASLAPDNTRALDRTAALHFRAGRLDQAVALLERWQQARADDPLPLLRQAVLLHLQGQHEVCSDRVWQAAALCSGPRRARASLLGARLVLQAALRPAANGDAASLLPAARAFLEDAVGASAADVQARWCLAAVCWLQGDDQALADQAAAIDEHRSTDARFHFLAAVCHLAAGAHERALEACQRVRELTASGARASEVDLPLESRYLSALAAAALGRQGEARADLEAVADSAGPSAALALAHLGRGHFAEGQLAAALRCWQALPPKQRQAWGLAEPLSQTMFAAALEDVHAGRYEQAAEQLRQAGRLGCRDRRLGHLLLLALFKAGQQAIYGRGQGERGALAP